MAIKKNKICFIFMLIFALTTVLFGSLFIKEKTKEETVTTYYLQNYYTQAPLTSKIYYKTLILRAFADDGQIIDLLNDTLNDYYEHPMLYCEVDKIKIPTKTKTIRLYYEYDIKIASTGQTQAKHQFINLEYEVLENKQVKFDTFKNETYDGRQMSTYYENKNLDLGFQLRFDYVSETTKK